jgi:hypothetical protein
VTFVVPGTAGAAVIGPQDITPSDALTGYSCFGNPSCTLVNLNVPDAKVRSPVSGTITRWRVNVADNGTSQGPLRLQVLRRTVNEPGNVDDEFKAIRQTSKETSQGDKNVFQASLRIRKGDYIGLANLAENTSIWSVDDVGLFAEYSAPLVPGDPAASPDLFPIGQHYLLYNATVRD